MERGTQKGGRDREEGEGGKMKSKTRRGEKKRKQIVMEEGVREGREEKQRRGERDT